MKQIAGDYSDVEKKEITMLALGFLVCTGLELFIHYSLGYASAYTHFFYLLIIVFAYFYKRKTIFLGIYLAILHITIEISITGNLFDINAIIRALMFIIVSGVSGLIFERIEEKQAKIVAYITEKAINRESPIVLGNKKGGDYFQTRAGADVIKMRRKKDVKGLISALKKNDVEYRYRSAIALGEIGDPVAIEPLSHLLSDENSGVRWEAAEALGKIGKPALDVLITALKDEDDDLRWRAAIALGDINEPDAIEPLISTLGDSDPYMRSRVAKAVSRYGKQAIEPLVRAFCNGDELVRTGVVEALFSMGLDIDEELKKMPDKCDSDTRTAIISALKTHKR